MSDENFVRVGGVVAAVFVGFGTMSALFPRELAQWSPAQPRITPELMEDSWFRCMVRFYGVLMLSISSFQFALVVKLYSALLFGGQRMCVGFSPVSWIAFGVLYLRCVYLLGLTSLQGNHANTIMPDGAERVIWHGSTINPVRVQLLVWASGSALAYFGLVFSFLSPCP